jgi:hypothetical protein
MSNKEYKERQRKRVMRQYRSNQGRSPNKVYETIKTLKVAFIILLIVSILCFVFL